MATPNGKSSYIKGHGPIQTHYCEACVNEYDARARELFLKSGMGKRYVSKRPKRFPSLTDESLSEMAEKYF